MDLDTVATETRNAEERMEEPDMSDARRRRLLRVRVTRACDRCKKRKQRCTGQQPCRMCAEAYLTCTYNSSYNRGRACPAPSPAADLSYAPPPDFSFDNDTRPLAAQDTHAEDSRSNTEGHLPSSQHVVPDSSDHTVNSSITSRDVLAESTTSFSHENGRSSAVAVPGEPGEPVSRMSPDTTETDLEGHYVGPSSGISFLLRVQKRLDQSGTFLHSSSIFNFGDAALSPHGGDSAISVSPSMPLYVQPHFDPTFPLLLSREHTSQLVRRYFEFAVPVDRFLHRPTIERWLTEFYDTMGTMNCKDDAPARIAVLFMVFAIAQDHLKPQPSSMESDMSIRYFHAANHQLSREQGAIRLFSVQARLCQCLWLLSQSRINHCWSLYGLVARLSLAIGLHRNRHMGGKGMTQVEVECRRRTFWSAYSLDNYLSTALGRPRTFHDDDIDQQLPCCMDDDELSSTHLAPSQTVMTRPVRGQSIMSAPIAYAKLSRIVSGVLRDIYSIRPTTRSDRHAFAAQYTKQLKEWRSDMSPFLSPDMNDAPLITIFRRQRNVLNFAYWHTMILTHRPLLLSNFAKLWKGGDRGPLRGRGGGEGHFSSQTKESVLECLKAAMDIVNAVDDIIQQGDLYRAFWFSPYFAFSASVVLYVYAIQQSSKPRHTYESYFAAAQRCQTQLSTIAESGSLTARYCLVLEELRAEVVTRTRNPAAAMTHSQTAGGRNMDAPKAGTGTGADVDGTHTVGDVGMSMNQGYIHPAPGMQGLNEFVSDIELDNLGVSPNEDLGYMTSWGQFDSMVVSGFGGLDLLLAEEQLATL